MTLEQSIQNITERQAQRRALVQESMARRMPEFPLELIRETFNARLEFYRSPEIEFGREEVLPGEVRFVPYYPIKFSRRGRALFEERVKPLPRVGSARKLKR